MITIFTTAKPFNGKAKISQYNALRSWKALHLEIEVILFGDGEGYVEAAADLGIRRVTDVETTDKGTPLISSMFSIAEATGKYPVQAYANCDIIFLDDFIEAIKKVPFERFMMAGQRWDLDINGPIDFRVKGWQKGLKERIRPEHRHPPSGSDYFVYKRGIWKGLPPMVVGRAGYDNYLIYFCRLNGIPVIDASDAITAIHQNHDYGHLKGGKNEAWKGAEAAANYALSGSYDNIFTLIDADYRLTPDGVVKNRGRGDLFRHIEAKMILKKDFMLWRLALFGLRASMGIYRRLPLVPKPGRH